MNIESGTRLGRYEIRSKIGERGMGEVYRARDTQLDRDIAIKILPSQIAQDQQRLHRFLQEARAAAALSHPNIAHIYEIGEADGGYFIAMEFVEGTQLDRKIGGQSLPVNEVLDIAIQITDALDEAHAKGIIHCDIKSSNIMITPRGRVKLLDFGLAKVTPTPASPDQISDSQQWSSDGRAIIYAITRKGVTNLWSQPIDGSPAKQLTNFAADRIFTFQISRDGKQVALSRGTSASDVVLINNFKK